MSQVSQNIFHSVWRKNGLTGFILRLAFSFHFWTDIYRLIVYFFWRAIELAELEARKQTLLKPLTASPQQGSSQPTPSAIKPIEVPQILKIINEIYCSTIMTSMSSSNSDLPLHQKLLVASLLLMFNHGKKAKEVTMSKLHETYAKVCKKRNMTAASLSEAVSMAQGLEARGIISLRSAKAVKDMKLSLRIDDDEVEAAVKDKNLLSGILHDADCISK